MAVHTVHPVHKQFPCVDHLLQHELLRAARSTPNHTLSLLLLELATLVCQFDTSVNRTLRLSIGDTDGKAWHLAEASPEVAQV